MEKSKKRVIWEYAEAIITALIIALFIRAYVVQAFKIPTGSMLQTLLVGDHILVNKFVYGTKLPFSEKRVVAFSDPEKGDIIVFKYPKNHSRDFIKRIRAVGGDTIMVRNKVVTVNGKPLEEPFVQYLDTGLRPGGGVLWRDYYGPVTVPPGKYFVMGDNRDNSEDSRSWGFVDRTEIRGRAMIIYWSWDGERKRPRLRRMLKVVH